MKPLCKVSVLLVLVSMVSPVLFAQVYGSVPTPAPRPAACHEHGQKAPTPGPVTYQCCRAAHQWAAVQEPVTLRAPFVPVSRVEEFGVRSLSLLVCRISLKPLVSGSPGITSLRI
jgi:hypothetical protein